MKKDVRILDTIIYRINFYNAYIFAYYMFDGFDYIKDG